MIQLTDKEFEQLEQRVANGKKHLTGKWHYKDRETVRLIRLWMDLVDTVIEQHRLRGDYDNIYDHQALIKSANEKIEHDRERIVRKKRGGRRLIPIESHHISLFVESS